MFEHGNRLDVYIKLSFLQGEAGEIWRKLFSPPACGIEWKESVNLSSLSIFQIWLSDFYLKVMNADSEKLSVQSFLLMMAESYEGDDDCRSSSSHKKSGKVLGKTAFGCWREAEVQVLNRKRDDRNVWWDYKDFLCKKLTKKYLTGVQILRNSFNDPSFAVFILFGKHDILYIVVV